MHEASLDGVVVSYVTLPGGAKGKYNLGRTATHEIGHWLGLYHTFQGQCSYPNDFVEDTPPQRTANECSYGQKSCQSHDFDIAQNGDLDQFYKQDYRDDVFDSVQNFMNYTPDACMNGFSQGQVERMRAHWALRVNSRSASS